MNAFPHGSALLRFDALLAPALVLHNWAIITTPSFSSYLAMSAELQASRRDATLILTISNPGARNALHPDIYAAAIETLSTAERDDSIRAVVLTGADNIFSTGESLHRLQENRAKDKSVQMESLDSLNGWIESIRDCPKPVIAAVEGSAANAGFALALGCDLIIAGESARFSMSYAATGLTPDGGASWLLTRALPYQLAAELLIGGGAIAAQRLHQLGIVNRLTADGTTLENALNWAEDMTALSPNAVENIKSLMQQSHGKTLSQHFDLEKKSFIESLHHRDAQEGISAALEKRKPSYRS
jgi:enoyl-CoA hydratase/carnithine racemase